MSDYGAFRYEYHPGTLQFGENSVSRLADELERLGLERALVVSGKTVGTTSKAIDPIKEGLGDKFTGLFAETTPKKMVSTAHRGVEAFEEADADVIVAVGGGSTLDVAKMMRVLSTSGASLEEATEQIAKRGTVDIPDEDLTPAVAIPTTLAGADLSIVAGTRARPEGGGLVDELKSGGISDYRLMPSAIFYDPQIFATTPKPLLAGSAMNGFDKGIESLYANCATPVTDGTALRGLSILSDALIDFGETSNPDAETLAPVIEGIMLVQYGIAQPHQTTMGLIHAFGHGLTRNYDVQQGEAHSILAPPALELTFDQVDGRRELIADGLGVSGADDPAAAVVEKVKDIRDALGLPGRLRDVEGPTREEFPTVIETVMTDAFMENIPSGMDVSEGDIEAVLEKAY